MSHPANYDFVWPECTRERLVIRDVGPHDRFRTITNDAERVVERLLRDQLLKPGRRLFYYDSQGEYSEILWQDQREIGFAPAESEPSKQLRAIQRLIDAGYTREQVEAAADKIHDMAKGSRP